MILTYCDRCRSVVKNPLMNSNSIEVHHLTQLKFDLCNDCMTQLKEWLQPLIEEEGESETL